MAIDHYISRFLTRRWEADPGRRLHFFDFETKAFDDERSKLLFAEDGLHSKETGDLLNDLVEQPIAQLLRQLETNLRSTLANPDDWKVYRALAAMHLLQSQRLSDAKKPGELAMTLDQVFAEAERAVDTMGHFARERFDLLVVTVPAGESLFFTEVAFFPIPLPGRVLVAIPLSPQHFFTLAPKGTDEQALQGVLAQPSLISGLSTGVASHVRRVIVPPAIVPPNVEDEVRVALAICTMRRAARRYVELVGAMSAKAGLDSWTVK